MAQLGSASALGAEGRGFESRCPDEKTSYSAFWPLMCSLSSLISRRKWAHLFYYWTVCVYLYKIVDARK